MTKISFRILCSLAACLLFAACHVPSKEDNIRMARAQYKLELDFSVGSDDVVTFEVGVQNLSGDTTLQELTVDAKAYDEETKVFWEKRMELDVAGLANYGTKKLQFKEAIPEASAKLDAFDVRLAPDDPSSNYKNYKEFVRIAN